MNFELLDISGDAGIHAFGSNRAEVFSNAALGMYSLITSPERILEKEERDIAVTGDTLDGLLVGFLNELIFLFDTYGFIGSKIRVTFLEPAPPFSLKATIRGEEFDPSRHDRRLLIKAATYHKLRLEEQKGRWEAEVIFDI